MAAYDVGAGAAIMVSLAGGAAAVGVAAAVVAWHRGLLSIRECAAVVGVTLAGAILLALLAPAAAPEPSPAAAPSPVGLGQRADALLARAIAPNSPLACIDAAAGDQVEAACEAVLFRRPETIAAAVSYVAAKLALVAQGGAAEGGAANDHALALLRRNLAADRYGIVAHVLATTAGCNAERCAAFAVVQDAARIKTNLRDGTFGRLIAKHAAAWPAQGERAPAMTDAGDPTPGASAAAPPGKPMSSRYDFPSAASIPPVSIMVPEEPRGASSGEAPAAASKPMPEPRPAAARPALPAPAVPMTAPPASPLPGPARAE